MLRRTASTPARGFWSQSHHRAPPAKTLTHNHEAVKRPPIEVEAGSSPTRNSSKIPPAITVMVVFESGRASATPQQAAPVRATAKRLDCQSAVAGPVVGRGGGAGLVVGMGYTYSGRGSVSSESRLACGIASVGKDAGSV